MRNMNTISAVEARALARKNSSISVLTRIYKEIEEAAIFGDRYIDNIDFSNLPTETVQVVVQQLKDLGYGVHVEFDLTLTPKYKIHWY